MSWVNEYIGQAWVYGEHDCFGFFRKVQKERFNREVPPIDVDSFKILDCVKSFTTHSERDNWVEVDTPTDGCAILMSQSKQPTHIGVWVGDGILHCVRYTGVVFTKKNALKSLNYNITGIYRAK